MTLLVTVEATKLQASRDIALMAVLLTLGGTAIVAGASRQVRPEYGTPIGLGLVLSAGYLALRMRAIAARVFEAAEEGTRVIDSLMKEEPEGHGCEEAHAG